jgi:hypothetical protein
VLIGKNKKPKMTNIEIKTYKKRALPTSPNPNSVYYILPNTSSEVIVYITDQNGVPIKIIDLTGGTGNIVSVTGTGVTGTASNPIIDIATFISTQLGNQVYLSTDDGKLQVNQTVSPDLSLTITPTSTELQIQLASSILAQINSALQPGDNVSALLNDANYITLSDVPTTSLVREEFEYVTGAQVFTLANDYYQVFSVEVQGGGALSTSQYTLIAPNKVQILDTLGTNDYVVIIYGVDLVITAVPYYTQAQVDAKLQVGINKTAGENISSGMAVVIWTDNLVYKYNISNLNHAGLSCGISKTSALTGETLTIVYPENILTEVGSGWSAGKSYFIASNSLLTITPPSSGISKKIATGIGIDTVIVNNYPEHILL